MKGFSVTFQIITHESAEYGEAEEEGFICENESLRDALSDFDAYGTHIESNEYPIVAPRWFTAYGTNQGTRDYYETGAEENRSLHIPDNVTNASRRRIARLLGCYGI